MGIFDRAKDTGTSTSNFRDRGLEEPGDSRGADSERRGHTDHLGESPEETADSPIAPDRRAV